ncbi:MAG: NAD-dependent epimerase/dehydratase family protein, partial [Lachnospiraceae bacterium]|nr:NAD-dependent epimerase/dehydratase family protein [Lachnospiraceae bacterium]
MEMEKSMKIMVTGAGGFVGSRLTAYYGGKYDVWGVTHKDLDLTDEAAVFKTVENYRPD